MTVSATQTLSSVNALVSARAASLREPSALTQKIPALATAPLAVSLGSTRIQPRVYDASGLMRGLLDLEQSGRLPTTRQSGDAAAELQADLETTLGLDSGSAGLSGSNRAALSANSASALGAVLARGSGDETGLSADLALQDLLAQTLGSFSSGLDRTRAAASAISVREAFRSAPADEALRAANKLPAESLALAAQALGTDRGAAASLAGSSQNLANNDASTQAFNRLLAADLEEALAETDAARPRRRHSSLPGTNDLLLAGFALPGAEADATTLPDPTDALEATPPIPGLAADALLRAGLRPLPASGNQAPQQAADATTDSESLPPLRPESVSAHSAEVLRNSADANAMRDTASTRAPPTPAANAASVSADRPREPRYAELAAAMTMGAAVYRFQTTVSVTVPPGELPPHRTVRAILAVPESKPIA
ncbi:MAG: hypothetical protein HZB40_04000 [Rhodocyclales bacterium]|nr:hypothetical protein [Rhodocyclales bacterium]